MQKEKTTVQNGRVASKAPTNPPKLVPSLPNEMIGMILSLIKKDHEAEVSSIIKANCIEVLNLKYTIMGLRGEIKHGALAAGLAANRPLFQPQHGGYAAPKHSHILWSGLLSILVILLCMIALVLPLFTTK